MPGVCAREGRRDARSGFVRPARILALIGLFLVIAAPSANAARPGIPHGKTRVHAVRARAECANADVAPSSGAQSAASAAVLCLVNQLRAAHGLPRLRENARLDHSAQAWTDAMVRTGSFWHGANFAGRIDAVLYDWQAAGENIATGYVTPQSVVSAWMASPDHCRNILNPGYADVGTGVLGRGIAAYGPSTWTQDFGLLMSRSRPSSHSGPMNACPYRR